MIYMYLCASICGQLRVAIYVTVPYKRPCSSRTCWGEPLFYHNSFCWTVIYLITSALLAIWALEEYCIPHVWWSNVNDSMHHVHPAWLKAYVTYPDLLLSILVWPLVMQCRLQWLVVRIMGWSAFLLFPFSHRTYVWIYIFRAVHVELFFSSSINYYVLVDIVINQTQQVI